MTRAANIVVGLIGVLHVYIMILEMYFWETAYGMKTFGTTPEIAAQSATLAANQGLYNGFLAAGLFWGLVYKPKANRPHIQLFFLACVLIAGIYGALTAKLSILFVQAIPAAIAMALVVQAMRRRTS